MRVFFPIQVVSINRRSPLRKRHNRCIQETDEKYVELSKVLGAKSTAGVALSRDLSGDH